MINTDAIDNSAGVDTSDHEVNLKILLEPPVKRGALSFEDRNQALAVMRRRSRRAGAARQSRSGAVAEPRAASQPHAFHLRFAISAGDRGARTSHREESAIPTREALNERHARYPGLTRPELALVTAYTKIDLIQRLEATALVDDSYLVGRFLQPYFPPSMAALADVGAHRLRHELIATRAVNELVDLAGLDFRLQFGA